MGSRTQFSNFKIGHLNTRSLLPSFLDFSDMLLQNSFDVFFVSETWLSQDIPSHLVSIPNYRLFRKDREGRGGGVAAYVNNQLNCEIININLPSITDIEHLWINFRVNKSSIALGVVYRPPQNNITNCIEAFDNIISYLMPSYDTVLMTGDVNINLFNLNNPLTSCCDSYGLSQIIDEPTRITQYSSTLIDPVFINNVDIIKNFGTLNADTISDHRLVFCEITLKTFRRKSKMHTYRDFRHFDQQQFDDDLNSVPWHEILYIQTIDDKIRFLTDNILCLFDIHAPTRTARMNKPHSPWLTEAIRCIIKEKENAFTKYKQNKTNVNWENYKTARNYAVAAVRREKAAYLKYLEKHDTAKLWKSLNIMNIHKKENSALPDNLSDPTAINNFFLSSFNLNPATPNTVNFYRNNKYNNNNFTFNLTDNENIYKIIKGIKSNAAGYDLVTLQMIKLCLPSILIYITHIVNCCLETGYFPSAWKQTIVCPLPKVKNPSQINDLRPISLVPVLSKILERVVREQLEEYLNSNKIIPSHQSGFRSGHSTTTALINISDNILKALDEKLAVISVFLDFSKAFDRVNHALLCAKLKYYGLDEISLNFFACYLQQRSQFVRTQLGTSSTELVVSGVPQGSVLGPLLFLLYTADISAGLRVMDTYAYADDIQLMYTFHPTNAQHASNCVNTDLNILTNYCKNNALQINALKTSAMLFCGKHIYEYLTSNIHIYINNEEIAFVEKVKSLGLILDKNFKFTDHVNMLIKKSYVSLRILYANKNIINYKIRKKLCECTILPMLNYCNLIYYSCLDVITRNRLQKIQNTCCRLIYGLRKYDHISAKIKELNWLKLNYTYKFHLLNFVHRILITSTPSYLRNKLIHRSQVHNLNIRQTGLLTMPHHKTAMFEKSFSYNAVKHYNWLDQRFKSYKVTTFRHKVKSFLNQHQWSN